MKDFVQTLRGCVPSVGTPISVPTLPDGSLAHLPIDQTPALEHNRNSHGWPANVIQEYADAENTKMQEMYMQRLVEQAKAVATNPSANHLTDAQMAALTMRRSAQTCSEFLDEGLRIAELRSRFGLDKVKVDSDTTKMESSDYDDSKNVDSSDRK